MSKILENTTVIDLFCGIGGLSHGFVKGDFKVAAGIDIDETCKYSFEANNKSTFISKSVYDISKREINELFGNAKCKILVGCAPCQPFSRLNLKKVTEKQLEPLGKFAQLIAAIQPDIVSMENVSGLADTNKYPVFAKFIKTLVDNGYKYKYEVVDVSEFGVPQKRKRLVLLASRLGEIEIIPPTHIPQEYKTVRDVIGKLHSIRHGKTYSKDPLHRAGALSPINLERIRSSIPGGTWRDWVRKLRAPCHRRKSGQTYSTVYSRMRWDKPSPTITTQFYRFGTGRFGHPKQDRAISLREGALLQTFPKSYDFIDPNGPKSLVKIGAHIGNAVPVKLGTIIGKSILKHLKGYYGEPIGT